MPENLTQLPIAASSKRTAKLTTLSAGKRGGIHHEGSPWANALKPYCVHPETFPKEEVVEYDDEFVVIYDKYPKAKQHLLVMPRKEMNGLASLGRDSLPVFEKLVSRGDAVADRWMDGWGFVLAVDGYLPMADGGWPVLVRAFWSRLKREHPELEFRKGFHAPTPHARNLAGFRLARVKKQEALEFLYVALFQRCVNCHRNPAGERSFQRGGARRAAQTSSAVPQVCRKAFEHSKAQSAPSHALTKRSVRDTHESVTRMRHHGILRSCIRPWGRMITFLYCPQHAGHKHQFPAEPGGPRRGFTFLCPLGLNTKAKRDSCRCRSSRQGLQSAT
ncbi:MAG: hypothetical protein BJ554DRAFT_6750 [Olpidium bornovanus]|uniref:HIT domain-containing protein n=1 Tax=Olpidium bornovanus TaxID=278681 RepID=A0A8H8DJW9_9FUNG|nr:MAG: hypothetical protein BJ554DRAFT_6750 [Olpidium bornovanus]